MSEQPEAAVSFDSSRVISRATEAIGSNLPLYLGLSLMLSGVPAFLLGWWQFGMRSDDRQIMAARYLTADYWLPFLAVMAVIVAFNAILQAAITRATASHLAGSRPGLIPCLETGLTLFVPMIVISMVIGLCAGIAALFLIVPGVILWLYWSMALPAFVQEPIGMFESLKRSVELTKGHRGDIFLIMLALGIGMAVLNWILRAMVGPMLGTATSQPLSALVASLFAAFNSMVSLTIMASIYIELRNVKDGALPNELAAIFA